MNSTTVAEPTGQDVLGGFMEDPMTGITLLVIFVLYKGLRFIAKTIPDSATGVLGAIRRFIRVVLLDRTNVQ